MNVNDISKNIIPIELRPKRFGFNAKNCLLNDSLPLLAKTTIYRPIGNIDRRVYLKLIFYRLWCGNNNDTMDI